MCLYCLCKWVQLGLLEIPVVPSHKNEVFLSTTLVSWQVVWRGKVGVGLPVLMPTEAAYWLPPCAACESPVLIHSDLQLSQPSTSSSGRRQVPPSVVWISTRETSSVACLCGRVSSVKHCSIMSHFPQHPSTRMFQIPLTLIPASVFDISSLFRTRVCSAPTCVETSVQRIVSLRPTPRKQTPRSAALWVRSPYTSILCFWVRNIDANTVASLFLVRDIDSNKDSKWRSLQAGVMCSESECVMDEDKAVEWLLLKPVVRYYFHNLHLSVFFISNYHCQPPGTM